LLADPSPLEEVEELDEPDVPDDEPVEPDVVLEPVESSDSLVVDVVPEVDDPLDEPLDAVDVCEWLIPLISTAVRAMPAAATEPLATPARINSVRLEAGFCLMPQRSARLHQGRVTEASRHP
jgi:hypothetical protein